jgi:UDP-galactopyranose mutase
VSKIIIVGSGFSGSILARKIAQDLNMKVAVIEKRSHIAGNMFDAFDEHGVLIQRYGPHFLNTNKYKLIEFLKQWTDLFPFNVKGKSVIDGKYVTLPYNFATIRELVGETKAECIYANLRNEFPGRDSVPLLELLQSNDADTLEFADILFCKAYKTYTSKMWDVPVDKIDRYVLDRVPVVMGYDDRYLRPDFQYLPVGGFTEMFNNMLSHPNIALQLNTDAQKRITFAGSYVMYDSKPVSCMIFTGNIDELFSYKFGKLPYRSLYFKYEHFSQESHLPQEIIYYPQAGDYTRSTEYRKIMFNQAAVSGTTVVTEFPLDYDKGASRGNIPYYPVVTDESRACYAKYRKYAGRYKNLFLCGRLAEFKYYNMDICIEHALAYFEDIKKYLSGIK